MYAVLFQEPISLLAPILLYFILFLVGGDSTVPENRKQDEPALWVGLFHVGNNLRHIYGSHI